MIENFLLGLEKFFGKYPFSVIFTNLFAIAFGLVIGWLCFAIDADPLQRILNALIAILGGLLGWALGMFFAPYNKEEESRFSTIGQTVSAFVTGYVISKLDRFLELTMFQNVPLGDVQVQVPVSITWVRIGILVCSILLVVLTVFSNRSYFRNKPEPEGVVPDGLIKEKDIDLVP